jgi:hypothetical protein
VVVMASKSLTGSNGSCCIDGRIVIAALPDHINV